jgi:hypothetical protein
MKRFFHTIKIEQIKDILTHAKCVFFAAYKKRKRVFALVFISLFFLIGTGIYFQYQTKNAKAAWWNDAWQYRKSIDIANNSTYTTTNKPYRTILDTQSLISTGKMQANGEDFRVVDKNGKTVRFQLEKSTLNTTTTGLWIEASIPAKTTATYFVYYGNSSAPALTFTSDVASVVNNGETVEMNDGYGYSTNYIGDLSDIRKNSVHIGVLSTNRYTTGYPSNWWSAIFTKTLLSQGPLFVEVKNDYGAIGSYSSLGSINKLFSNGFVEEMVYMNYNTSGTDTLYYYLGFDNGTRNSVWVNGSGVIVDQAPDSPVLSSADLGDNWFGQRWTATGKYGGTIINKNGSDWVSGYTSAQASYYQTNFSSSLAYTPGSSRQIRFGTFAGDGGLAEMNEKGSTYGANSSNVGSEEKGTGPVAYWTLDDGSGVFVKDSAWKKNGTMTNLVTNPSFETGTTGWGFYGGGVLSQSFAASFSGNSSLKLVYDTLYPFERANFSTYAAGVTMNPLTTYTASVWVKRGQGATTPSLNIKTTINGGEAGGSSYVIDGISSDEWQKISYTFTTGATENGIYLMPGIRSAVNGDYIYIDAVQLEVGGAGNLYCDGSVVGNGSHAWAAAAHSSTSVCDTGSDGEVVGANWNADDQCAAGKCLEFDGVTSFVKMPNKNTANVSGDITVSTWIKPKIGSQGVVLHKDGQYTLLMYPSGALTWADSSTWSYASFGSIDVGMVLGQWNYITVTKTGGIVRMYLNGVEKGSKTFGGAIAATNAILTLGCYSSSGVCTANYFGGKIDDVKIYSYARTAKQVQTDYDSAKTGMFSQNGTVAAFGGSGQSWMSDGLVGYWKMDENVWNGTASEVRDSSGNMNHGVAVNGTVTSSGGKFGNSGIFNGTTNYVNAGTGINPSGKSAWTISSWVYSNAGEPGRSIVGWWDGTSGIFLQSKVSGDGFTAVAGDTNSYGEATFTTANTWVHATLVYDGSQTGNSNRLKLYINGIPQSLVFQVGTVPAVLPTFTNASQWIGNVGNLGRYWNGKIDEVRNYSRALSAQEVAKLYAYAPSPVLDLKLDENTGNTFADKSGNGYNGNFGVNGGDPSWTEGKSGSALNFGAGKYGKVSLGAAMNNFDTNVSGRSFSYSMWFKSSNVSATQTILSNNEACNNMGNFTIGLQAGNIRYGYYGAGGGALHYFTPVTALQNNQWYHLEWTKTFGQLGVKAYLNGVPQTVVGDSVNLGYTNLKNILLGAWNGDGVTCTIGVDNPTPITTSYLNGALDEVKIYNYIRTQKQVLEDMSANAQASKNLVGYWKFDEGGGTTAKDSSGKGNDLTVTTAQWKDTGKINKALDYPGNGQALTADSPALDFGTNDFSVSFWANTRDYTYPKSLVSMSKGDQAYTAGHPGWEFGNGYSGAGYTFAINDGTNKVQAVMPIDAGFRPADVQNKWAHYVFSVSRSSGKVKLYINGTKQSTELDISSVTGSVDNVFGFQVGLINGWSIDGLVDEVKLYNYALSDSDVSADYNQNSSVTMASVGISAGAGDNAAKAQYCVPGDASTCNSPVAQWNFDEKTGSVAKDTSGNNNNGTITGATWTTGKTGSGLSFNGTSSYVDIATNPTNFDGDWNISFWANNLNQHLDTRGLITKSDNTSYWTGKGFGFTTISNPDSVYFYASDGTNQVNINTGVGASYGWTYFSAVKSGTNISVYVNARLVGTISTATLGSIIGTQDLFIGKGNSGSYLGKIDGVKIYSYARTPAQIAYDYNRGAPIGWWKMDECQGNTIFDSSISGNNGTITVGAAGWQTELGTCTTASTAWANGKIGKYSSSFSFDGTDDRIAFGDVLDFEYTQPFSLSAWFKSSANDLVNGDVISKQNSTMPWGGYSMLIRGDANDQVEFELIGDLNFNGIIVRGTKDVTDMTWHHLVTTYDGTNNASGVKIYVDGVQETTTTVSNVPIGTSTLTAFPFQIGARNGANVLLNGQVDDARVYNYVLTKEQVGNVMNEGSALRFGQ